MSTSSPTGGKLQANQIMKKQFMTALLKKSKIMMSIRT